MSCTLCDLNELRMSTFSPAKTVLWFVQSLMPSVCNREDASQLLHAIVRQKPSAVVLCDSIITCEEFLTSCATVFETLINVKAEKASVLIVLFSFQLNSAVECIVRKRKEEYLYSAIYTMHSLKALRHGSQFYLQITSCLPFLRKRSRFTHISGHPSATVQDRKSSPANDWRSTVLCHDITL